MSSFFQNKEESDTLRCPQDNKIMRIDIKLIPICYQILSNLPLNKNKLNAYCTRHPNKKIKYFCSTHSVFPCSNCVVDHMGVGHELEAFELNTDKINQEWGNLLKMYEFEYSEVFSF